MKRAALYARVSTDKCRICGRNKRKHEADSSHAFKGQDSSRQLRELRLFAKAKGWTVVIELTDEMSAAKFRPGLEKLWRLVESGKVDVIIVHEFTRFARSTIELLHALTRFQKAQADFISLKEQIDTSTAMGKMVFTVMAALAEFERALISERVRSGMANAAAKGIRLGRPAIGFEQKKPRAVLNLAQVLRWRAQGVAWRTLEKKTGVSSRSLRRAVKMAGVGQKGLFSTPIESAQIQ
jgi:DNA invertase Pin-like site-specific DNA recombinase